MTLAVKVYEKYRLMDIQRKKSVIKEIKIMKKLEHDNIVTLYDAIDTPRQVSPLHSIKLLPSTVVLGDGKRLRLKPLVLRQTEI